MAVPDYWEAEFVKKRPVYELLTSRLAELLVDLLGSAGVDVIQVEKRTKSVTSFAEKIHRKAYSDPWVQLTDIVGLRVVTYYVEDVDLVEAILRDEFEVDEDNSIDKSVQMSPDQFGYLSRHFVVKLAQPRLSLKEWQVFEGMRAEVQVRTALQHAWAAVQHKLEYKSEREVPLELRRGLYRLSALFELADSQFSAFRDATNAVKKEYNHRVEGGDRDLPLNVNSLHSYLTETGVLDRLVGIAKEANWVLVDGNARSSTHYRRMVLDFSEAVNIRTVREFDAVIPPDDQLLLGLFRALLAAGRGMVNKWDHGPREELLTEILVVRHPALDSKVSRKSRQVFQQVRRQFPELLITGR